MPGYEHLIFKPQIVSKIAADFLFKINFSSAYLINQLAN